MKFFSKKAFGCLFIVAILASINSFGQNELWYFGTGAGMAFTGPGNSPVARPGEAAVGFYESLTTVGDGSGNPLWYTDGINVYDATHTMMPNTGGILGSSDGGTGSANQGVITMPYPGNADRYIMWTVPATDGTPSNGMRYHVIDMTLPGNGTPGAPLGDLLSKNNLVSGGANVAEMLAGGRVNGNCNVMYAIAHETGSNNFIINRVEDVGGVLTITTNTQSIGPVVNGGGSARGAMDISPDGTRIALCGGWPTGSHMFDFDTNTGTISNWTDLGSKFVAGNQWRYGVFFSPDNDKIYFSNGSYGVSPKLVQYNILTDALTTVYNGGANISEFALGLDGVIYAGKTTGTSLAIMNNPDAATGGATGFVENGYALGGGSLNFGLPQFTYCFLNNPCPDTTIGGSIPAECAGAGTVDLSLYEAGNTGTWSITNAPGGSTATITGGNTFNINSTTAGNYELTFSIAGTGGSCDPNPTRILEILDAPTITNTTDGDRCGTGTVNLGATASSGTINWYAAATGGASLGTGTSFTTPSISSTTVYYVDATDGGCTTGARTAVTATINDVPTGHTAVDAARCGTGTVNLSVNNVPAGTEVDWYDAASGGTLLQGNSTSYTTPSISSTTIYYAELRDAVTGCLSAARVPVTATVNPDPTVSLTLVDDGACADEGIFALDGGTPVPGGAPETGDYSGPGITTSPNFDPSAAGVGVHTITYTYTDANGCSSTATDDLEVFALPVVGLVIDPNAACLSAPDVTLTGGTPVPAGPPETGVYSGPGITSSPTLDPSAAGAGVHLITYTYTDANGCSAAATGNFEVYPDPVVALTLVDDDACEGDAALALDGGTPVPAGPPASGTYSGTGITASPTFDPVAAGVGVHTITYTYFDNNGCTGAATDDFTVNAAPTGATPDDGDRCGTGTVNLSVSNVPAGVEIDWYDAATGGSLLQANSTTYTTPSINATTIYYAEMRNATTGCTGTARIAVNATINDAPTGATANDDGRCGPGTVDLSVGNVPAGVEVDWYDALVAGNQIAMNSVSYTTPSISATTIYYAELRNPTTGCLSAARIPVTATINDQPTGITANDDSRCGAGTVNLSVGNIPAGSEVDWYDASTGGVLLQANSASYTTPSISSTTIYYAELRDAVTGCTSVARVPVTATVNDEPTGVTAVDGSNCGTGTVNLSVNNVPAGTEVDWYDASTGGALLQANATSYTTPSISTTTVYYVELRNTTTGCVSSSRVPVTATINDIPSGATANDDSRCGEGTVNLSLSGVPAGVEVDWYDALTGGTLLQGGIAVYTTPSISATTIYYAELRDATTGCLGAARIPVTATVNDLPAVSVNSGMICPGDPAMTFMATAPTAIDYLWSDLGMGTTDTTTGSLEGDYTVTVRDVLGCENSATGVLTFTSPPSVTVNDAAICAGDAAATFTADAPTAISFVWTDNGTGNGNTTTGTTPGLYTVTVDDGTCTNTASGTLTVYDLPTPDLGPTVNVCEGVPVEVNAGNYVGYVWHDGSISDVYSVSTTDTISVTVEDVNGCFGSDTTYSVLRARPVLIELREDTTICEEAGDVVPMVVQNSGVSILWQDSSDVMIYEATTAGTYTVQITDEYGCRDTGEVVLTALCSTIDITMPNVFTPDGTGINDYFIPIEMEWADKDFMYNNVQYVRFYVYNRWGVMVHASSGVLPRWDGFAPNGEQCSDGTYFWTLQYQDHANESQNFNGFVRLLNKKY